MDHDNDDNMPAEYPLLKLVARDLYETEMHLREEGESVFIFDEELDVFRFPEDDSFAFCKDFADWERLRERGYLDF
jgi:hypothetical protein